MENVLLVNHSGKKCGVYQFGAQLYELLRKDETFKWSYVECRDKKQLFEAIENTRPDAVVFNSYERLTMPWLTPKVLASVHALKLGVFHEACQENADVKEPEEFDFYLAPDPYLIPRNPIILPVSRFIPRPLGSLPPAPDIFTVGSFGFATADKGFEWLCGLVNEQCDRAVIRINIPMHDRKDVASADSLAGIESACRKNITKKGIELVITHEFYENEGLLGFLSGNSLNAFLYTSMGKRGISSCTDHALAAGRPIAVSRSPMFRHMHGVNPSICVEDMPLERIAENGSEHLEPLREAFSPESAARSWTEAIAGALELTGLRRAVPDGRGFNKILDKRSRQAYKAALGDLERFAPEALSRKIPESTIQQAFALDAIERLAKSLPQPRILALGSYEDTAVASLKAKGYRIDEVDPNLNLDLNDFYLSPETRPQSYNIIACISVLEHVADDELFVQQIADLLEPGGFAILTVDFNDRYLPGRPKPNEDFRLYTNNDILSRLMSSLGDCGLIDTPSWRDGKPDFNYGNCTYNFASWVFRKLPGTPFEYGDGSYRRVRTTPWKTQLVIPFPKQLKPSEGDRCLSSEYRPKYADLGVLLAASGSHRKRAALLSEVVSGRTSGLNSTRGPVSLVRGDSGPDGRRDGYEASAADRIIGLPRRMARSVTLGVVRYLRFRPGLRKVLVGPLARFPRVQARMRALVYPAQHDSAPPLDRSAKLGPSRGREKKK